MKLTKNNLIKKLGMKDEDTINLILEYQKQLPILTEDGEGFCVKARDLHTQLQVGRDYSTWIKQRIKKYEFVENEDYITFTQTGETVTGGFRSIEHMITTEVAKQLAMLQNNDSGKIARKYFITMEKTLKDAVAWDKIRKPEKERYKEMCQELEKYMIRNFNKIPMKYDYMNEANALNKVCLGANAKDIRDYIEANDSNTREWLTAEYNEYLDKMQELNIMYLKMNLEKVRRYDLIKQGFKALYPNASFFMANKEDKDNKAV